MIKKIIKTVCGFVLIIGLLLFLAYSETHYTRTGVIINNDSYCVFKDGTGNTWEFYSDTLIPVNANIKAKFFNNNTMDNIYDDILIDYEIVGYVDEITIKF